jgi:hypothetical protein
MPRNRPAPPLQGGLFGASLSCPDIDNLPLIVEPQGAIEVLAPGSVYQPLLLSPREDSIDVGPGKLDEHEEAFVRDLIRRLYPAGNHPKSSQTPLKWGHKEIWLKRNIEKRDDSFRLRVDDSDWFYPDFIVWIRGPRNADASVRFCRSERPDLGGGTAAGRTPRSFAPCTCRTWLNASWQASGQKVEFAGQTWTFRVRGVLVSTSPLASLSAQAKFSVRDGEGRNVAPGEADFKRARIVFQKSDTSYIDEVLQLLCHDSQLDELLAVSATLFDNNAYFTPAGEVEHELALRHDENTHSESDFVAAVVGDYLRPDATGHHGVWASKNRRRQLMDYASDGKWGFGGEKVSEIRDHPTPCEELWKRKKMPK